MISVGRYDPRLNYVQVYHGPEHKGCPLKPGDLLVETWNRGKASVDIEWTVSKSRVDDPNDHAVYCTRFGPDVGEETTYGRSDFNTNHR